MNISEIDAKAGLRKGYLCVLVLAILFFGFSCSRSLLWQDSGMIQYRVLHNDIEGGLGLALSHPLFYIIAIGVKYIGIGGFAFRVNFVSAMAAAVTVANLFLFLRIWLKDNVGAVVGAVTLAVSHTFWRHGSIVETYTLYTAFLSAELVVLALYFESKKVGYLYWLMLLNGLSISVHMLGSIALACYGVFVLVLIFKRQLKFGQVVLMGLVWIVGAGVFEYLIIKNIILTGDVKGVLMSAAFGDSWADDVLNTSITAKIIKENVMFFGLNFPTPNILFLLAGGFCFFKYGGSKGLRNIILGLTVLFLIFASRYTIVDRYAFFIPFYMMVCVFVGMGVTFVLGVVRSRLLAVLVVLFCFMNIGVYAFLPEVAKSVGLKLGTRRVLPYRDDHEFFLWPWKSNYRGAERFAKEALGQVGDGGMIFADGTSVYPLLVFQEVNGYREDVKIVSWHGSIDKLKDLDEDIIDREVKSGLAYVVSPVRGYCPGFILEKYDYIGRGVLFQILESN